MATIISKGKQSVDSLANGLRFEQDNNRIIGRANDNKPNLIISSVPGESPLIEVAQDGYDVLSATDDQKVMSSRFNMWKIIANGHTGYNYTPGVYSRSGTLALNSTYLGYENSVFIDTGIDTGKVLDAQSDVLMNITNLRADPFNNTCFIYHDGTNIVWNHNFFYFNPFNNGGQLVLVQRFRMLGGSYTITPNASVKQDMKWSICNQTLSTTAGGGAVGPLSGKYYYKDVIYVDKDGTITTPLASTTVEFIVGAWEIWL